MVHTNMLCFIFFIWLAVYGYCHKKGDEKSFTTIYNIMSVCICPAGVISSNKLFYLIGLVFFHIILDCIWLLKTVFSTQKGICCVIKQFWRGDNNRRHLENQKCFFVPNLKPWLELLSFTRFAL